MANAHTENDDLSLERLARHTMRAARLASLGTLDRKTGAPVVTQLVVAFEPDGTPILLLSPLAMHTQNLQQDARLSLLFEGDSRSDRLMDRVRLTVQGTLVEVDPSEVPALKARYVARHPDTEAYDRELNFHYYRVSVTQGRLVRGFGATKNLRREALLPPCPAALSEAEAGIVDHMNADHGDAVQLYAEVLAGLPEATPDDPWRMTGIDMEGVDLGCINHSGRVEFEARVEDAQSARQVLVDLVKQARQKIA